MNVSLGIKCCFLFFPLSLISVLLESWLLYLLKEDTQQSHRRGGVRTSAIQGTGQPAAGSSIPWSSASCAMSPASNHELVLNLTMDASHLGDGNATYATCADQADWAMVARPAQSGWTRAVCGRRHGLHRCERSGWRRGMCGINLSDGGATCVVWAEASGLQTAAQPARTGQRRHRW